MVRIGDIINYVRDTRGLDPIRFGQWEENIEDFLSEIDVILSNPKAVSKLSFGTKLSLDKAYSQMMFLFSSVLNEIQNGDVCVNYSKICRSAGSEDCFITFNWDTLLDRSLQAETFWRPDVGYGFEFHSIFRDKWVKPEKPTHSAPSLIKLHGSTNWLMPYFSLDYRYSERRFANKHIEKTERPIFCFHSAQKRYPTFGDRSRTGYQPFSYFYYPPNLPIRDDDDSEPGRRRMAISLSPDTGDFGNMRTGFAPTESMPLIIPPVRNKQYSLMGDTFDSLWDDAQIAIQNCDKLLIIGYSFPQTDTKSWELLSGAIQQRGAQLPVLLVDPYPQALEARLVERFPHEIALQVEAATFEQFISAQN